MIKHIVLFKLKSFESDEAKQEKLNEIKSALESLPAVIPQVKHLSVGLNCNANESHDFVLDTTFASFEDLDIYAKHPEHVAVVGIIKPHAEHRACVDYEL